MVPVPGNVVPGYFLSNTYLQDEFFPGSIFYCFHAANRTSFAGPISGFHAYNVKDGLPALIVHKAIGQTPVASIGAGSTYSRLVGGVTAGPFFDFNLKRVGVLDRGNGFRVA